jgi:GNAT superfamily N-acetyltransferase
MAEITVRAARQEDRTWMRQWLSERWGSTMAACLSGLHDAATLDGLVAELDGERVGLLTYRIDGGDCEVVTIDSSTGGRGIGRTLLEAVADLARARGCRRAWLTTTNDNLPALRAFQRCGWDLVRLHHNAVHEWRRTLKPRISQIGRDGIPLAHALELERLLL